MSKKLFEIIKLKKTFGTSLNEKPAVDIDIEVDSNKDNNFKES